MSLAAICTHQGMSDDQQGYEIEAQKCFSDAVEIFRAAIREINHSSAVITISEAAFNDFIHDECPDIGSWNARISEARQ